jgi:hypothetical protein
VKIKITEMNNCIEEMRKCYKFNDDETEIRLGNPQTGFSQYVEICTKDKNGTRIEMSRYADELK